VFPVNDLAIVDEQNNKISSQGTCLSEISNLVVFGQNDLIIVFVCCCLFSDKQDSSQ